MKKAAAGQLFLREGGKTDSMATADTITIIQLKIWGAQKCMELV